MKIAFDATALYGQLGGIENALWQTFSQLARLDTEHHYLVFVPRDAPEAPFPPNSHWAWHRLPFDGAQKLRRIAWQQLELPLWLRRERCDLLHAWNYVAPLACSVPFVLTVQDTIALDRPRFATRFNRLHYRAVMPRSLKRATRVIVTTEATKQAVLRRANHAQIRVAPLGVEPIFFEDVSRAQRDAVCRQYDLPPHFLLYVGNFEPKKNLVTLLQALRLLPHAPPLVLAGGIKPWPAIEKQLSGVQRIGFVPREDLPALYAACDVFCFPSRCEGFGLPVVEALACGAPVLASTEVPLPNLGTVAAQPNPHCVRSIAENLQGLLLIRSADKTARRQYAHQFTWENTARRTLAVYDELK